MPYEPYEPYETECERHPRSDYFGPGTSIIKCAHLGNRFVVWFRTKLDQYVDYVEDQEGGRVIVEGHYIGFGSALHCDDCDAPQLFDRLEALMLGGTAPDPDPELELG